MNKKEFLSELKENLIGLSTEDVNEIIEDYKEHFLAGKREKRKESEIAKALGNPREIARDASRELGKNSTEISIERQLIEFWIDVKKLGKRVLKNINKEIPKAKKEVLGIFSSLEISVKNKKNKKVKTTGKKRVWAAILLILVNLLIMAWVWFSLFMTIISLFITGMVISTSGFAIVLASLFVLINPADFMARNIGVSGFFAGIGLFFMGVLWSIGTSKLMKGFSYITKQYIRLNKRLSRK